MKAEGNLLEAALRKAAPEAADADIRRYAEKIGLKRVLAGVNHYRQSGRGPADGRKDLEALHSALQAAFAAAQKCRPDACQALLLERVPQADIKRAISELGEVVRAARNALPVDDGPLSTGKPRDRLGPSVTAACAKAYEALTEKTATVSTGRKEAGDNTAYGPFYDFVSDVFQALKITSSPEYCTRSFIKKQQRRKPSKSTG